jgi:hypothetical protein
VVTVAVTKSGVAQQGASCLSSYSTGAVMAVVDEHVTTDVNGIAKLEVAPLTALVRCFAAGDQSAFGAQTVLPTVDAVAIDFGAPK